MRESFKYSIKYVHIQYLEAALLLKISALRLKKMTFIFAQSFLCIIYRDSSSNSVIITKPHNFFQAEHNVDKELRRGEEIP